MTQNNFDIVIIGGSFAGMTSALCLANISSDIKIAIIEKNDIINQDRQSDGRGYAISSQSLQVFQELGIYDQLQKNAGKIQDIKITDCNSPFILNFFGNDVNKNNQQLGQIIESFEIHNALRDKILQQKNIKIFSPDSYQTIDFGDQNKIKINNKTITSKIILACDGRFSELRKKYNIHTITKKYHQTAIVFNVNHQKNHNNCAWEKFYAGGPLAILPLKNQNQSSIVWIIADDKLEAYLDLDNKNFIHQLEKKIKDDVGNITKISEKFTYPLTLVEAEKFYHEKLIFIGDAACGIHPIAGQGFNLAISGIKILQNLISQKYLNGLEINSTDLFSEYNQKARKNAIKMAVATDLLNTIFETKSTLISTSRQLGLGIINKIPKLKKIFIKSAGGYS